MHTDLDALDFLEWAIGANDVSPDEYDLDAIVIDLYRIFETYDFADLPQSDLCAAIERHRN